MASPVAVARQCHYELIAFEAAADGIYDVVDENGNTESWEKVLSDTTAEPVTPAPGPVAVPPADYDSHAE